MLPRVRTLSGCSTYSSTSSPSSTMAMRERSLLALMTISFFMGGGRARQRSGVAVAGRTARPELPRGFRGRLYGRGGGRHHGGTPPPRPTGQGGGGPAGERAGGVRG